MLRCYTSNERSILVPGGLPTLNPMFSVGRALTEDVEICAITHEFFIVVSEDIPAHAHGSGGNAIRLPLSQRLPGPLMGQAWGSISRRIFCLRSRIFSH